MQHRHISVGRIADEIMGNPWLHDDEPVPKWSIRIEIGIGVYSFDGVMDNELAHELIRIFQETT
jgi:hypothetical protein